MNQIFNRQTMQPLVIAQHLNYIPAEPVHIDPTALDPGFLFACEEWPKSLVIEFVLSHLILREVNDRDLALPLQVCR
jgi:hypothetical protein